VSDKISDKQLGRAAYVYIRQSTLQQVRHNLESNRRQYALRERALELGFPEVVVIDDDLGISGAGHRERPGFGRLLAAVCDGKVGAVFALEASRLARNNRDWHHLIDLCVLTETVVVDAEGIYDPRLLNDRLLLGLKGTMSEFELGILRQRAQEAYRQKVLRGEVLTKVPVGYVRTGTGGVEITPDREIQEAVRGVFTHFDRLGTLRQVLLWYHQEKVLLPRIGGSERLPTLAWQLPDYQQLLRILKNPLYAGAFAYGRTQSRSQVIDGRSRKSGGHRVSMEHWQILLKDHHAAYISWERYVENQRILSSNRTKSHAANCGAPKKGSALLAGLLRCARCGHKLHVGYRGRNGRGARYYCMTGNREQGQPSCLSFGALRMEQAIVNMVLEACEPLGVEAALKALAVGQLENMQKKRAFELAWERAQYEAERARRQYDAVDPSNRLVAAELEARWNAALTRVSEAQARLQSERDAAESMTEEQRRRLHCLGTDLSAAWNDPVAPVELKKRILRTVIKEIVADVNDRTESIEMQIHWIGGVHTTLKVRKNRVGLNGNATNKNVVELVRELAKAQSDTSIAATLNRLGYHTGPGNNWNQTRVKNLRLHHKIPVFDQSHPPGWVTMAKAAAELQVNVAVVRTMVAKNILPARQFGKGAPWMIDPLKLTQAEVHSYVKSARAGKPAPRQENNQTTLPLL
jgi:DNA invertase Pin-like site-specific DNA recombinase